MQGKYQVLESYKLNGDSSIYRGLEDIKFPINQSGENLLATLGIQKIPQKDKSLVLGLI